MLYTQGFKGIVHPKMNIGCLSAFRFLPLIDTIYNLN